MQRIKETFLDIVNAKQLVLLISLIPYLPLFLAQKREAFQHLADID